ncbi:cobalamin-dependent protein [Streptomyces sp. NPDC090029]|uniref:cobalamin-dependent protein n=1 Tax=Streptomyces sp. NPDC090029 TaxID=3365924 RepID=UPI003816B994
MLVRRWGRCHQIARRPLLEEASTVTDRRNYTVVLAGVGGDSHSVGLFVLRRSLERAGFAVDFLSTQNTTAELCDRVGDADAVLVSNMDGHAAYYLRDLHDLRTRHGANDAVWYLGGNPALDDDESTIDELYTLGFQRVFLGYVDPAHVVSCLDEDLAARAEPPTAGPSDRRGRRRPAVSPPPPLQHESFESQREEVLAGWHTGPAALSLEENAAVCSARAELAQVQARAEREGRVLIHPRTGVAGIEEQTQLFGVLHEAGADVLSFQIDSLTRNNHYEQVELLLKESDAQLGSFRGLNGFPLVNHGVTAGRTITARFPGTPFQVRHSTKDPRLLAEITYASGVTAFEGGALTYNLPYYRDYSPRHSVPRWAYVDRLTGLYYERFGITIDREFFGVLTAAMLPACIAVVACALEALLAANAGVKSVSLGYAEQGNRAQDIGAIRALRRVGRHYLDRHGHEDVAIHTVFHQYMAAFPEDARKSNALLHGSALTARLSGATRLMLKTAVESTRIPSAANNAEGLLLVKSALEGPEVPPMPPEAVFEEDLIIKESTAILDAILAQDAANLGEQVALAVERGLLDVPFSPNLWNAGQAMCVRDCTGAVRFAETGAIPLPESVRRFHTQAVQERLRRDRADVEVLVERDVLRTARGAFDTWPLTD